MKSNQTRQLPDRPARPEHGAYLKAAVDGRIWWHMYWWAVSARGEDRIVHAACSVDIDTLRFEERRRATAHLLRRHRKMMWRLVAEHRVKDALDETP